MLEYLKSFCHFPVLAGTFAAITNLENEVFSPHSSEVKLEVTNESSELEESTKGFKSCIQCLSSFPVFLFAS